MNIHKPSKFNYKTKNCSGELLLYNSFAGCFCKISSENAEAVSCWLNTGSMPNEQQGVLHDIYMRLAETGFFVPAEQDEDIKLNLFGDSNTLNMTILPTEQCNFQCPYCFESFRRGKMTPEIQKAITMYVQKHIGLYSSMNVSWFGGEPLIAMDVVANLSRRLINICKAQRRHYFANLTTNGYCLDVETFRELLSYNITHYYITIDGLKATHDQQRPLADGSGTFDVILNNLINIMHSFKTGRFNIVIRTNITTDVYTQFDAYIKYFSNIFKEDERFSFLFRVASDFGNNIPDYFREKLMGMEGLGQTLQCLVKADDNLKTIHGNMLMPGGSMCSIAAQRNSWIIDAVGNIRKCECYLDDDENNLVGRLHMNGVMEIDEYKHARWLTPFKKNSKCSNCFFLPVCQYKRCPAKAVIFNQGISGCPHERVNIDIILLLLDKTEGFKLLG